MKMKLILIQILFIYSLQSNLFLHTGFANKPKDEKEETGGEDAFLVSQQLLAVADGLEKWDEQEINAGLYAKQLLRNLRDFYSIYKGDVKILLEKSTQGIRQQGSATLSFVEVDIDQMMLTGANLGDSGYKVFQIKNDEIFIHYESCIQEHKFNHPFQLGTHGDSISQTEIKQVKLKELDIIIVGTQGFWNNIWLKEIYDILAKYIDDDKIDVVKASEEILDKTYQNSKNTIYDGPYKNNAKKHGEFIMGGKPDDITFIVGQIKQMDKKLNFQTKVKRGMGSKLQVEASNF